MAFAMKGDRVWRASAINVFLLKMYLESLPDCQNE